MRKILIGISLLIVVVAAVFGWNYYEKQVGLNEKGVPFDQLLSEKPILYLEFFDAGELWDSFRSSNFYARLGHNPLVKNVVSSADWKEFNLALKDLEKRIGFPLNEENMKAVLGRDFAIALFARKRTHQKEVKNGTSDALVSSEILAQDLAPDIEMLFRLNPKARVGSMILDLSSWIRNDSTYTRKEHRGHSYYQINTGSPVYPSISLFSGRGILIVASREEDLRGSIDRMEGEVKKEFSDFLGKCPEGCISLAYVNNDGYQEWLNRLISNSATPVPDPDIEKKWRDIWGNLTGETVCYGIWDDGLRLEGKSSVKDPNSLLASLVCRQPERVEIAKYLPSNTFLLWWTNSVDLVKIKELVDSLADSDPKLKKSYDDIWKGIQTNHGIDLNKLISVLGPKFGIALVPPDNSSPITLPGLLTFLETSDRDFVDKIITRLVREPGKKNFKLPLAFGLNEIKKDKFVLHYVPTPVSLAPGYLFVDSYLVGGLRLSDFESVMNLAAGKADGSISKVANFREVISADKMNNLFYLDMNGFLGTIRELVDRYPIVKASWTVKDEENFQGILELLEVIKAVGAVSYWKEPVIEFSYRVLVKDFMPENRQRKVTSRGEPAAK